MNATTRSLNPGLFPDETPASAIDERKFPPARTNASNTGKSFQKEMETTADGYHARRSAMIRKVDPPVRVFWKTDDKAPSGRRQVVIFLANQWLDFAGVWTARDSRALLVEAKSTSTHRLPFNGSNGAGLKMEQVASIRTWSLAGAAVAVVWQWAGRVCLFTPDMLVAAEARGQKSLVFESGLPVARGEGNVLWDYLATLDKALYRPEPPPEADRLIYRGLTVQHFPGVGYGCEKAGVGGEKTLERALAAVDVFLGSADNKANDAPGR